MVRECDVVALPISNQELVWEPELYEASQCDEEILKGCVAYQITYPNVPDMNSKQILLCPMPMCKDKKALKATHDRAADAVAKLVEQGKKVAFLTLGDPTVYSTYLYVHKRVQEKGLPVEIINGIPSFCASAARMGIGLVENKEQLHMIPSSYDIEDGIKLPGTKVLMKAGKKMEEVKEKIKQGKNHFYMVENCGMENEKVYTNVDEVPDKTSYYSLIILKEEKE